MAMSPRRRHCDLAATSQSGRRYITWQLLHIGITFLSKCDVAATSQWSHLATFIQKLQCTWRHPCDFSAMSQLGRRQFTWRLLYTSRIFVQMRCRSDIAVRSLGDFHKKKLYSIWRHPCDFSAMSHLGRRQSTWRLSYKNHILVKMRCRGDIAGGSLGDFYIKLCISLGDLHAMSQ